MEYRENLYIKKIKEYTYRISKGEFDDYLTEQQKEYVLWELNNNTSEFAYGVITGMLIMFKADKVV